MFNIKGKTKIKDAKDLDIIDQDETLEEIYELVALNLKYQSEFKMKAGDNFIIFYHSDLE